MTSKPARQIWEAALGELQVQVSKHNFQTWFQKTVGLSFEDDQFTVGVPNTFVAEYLNRNQFSLIEKTLIGITKQNIQVNFQVNGNDAARCDNGNGANHMQASPYASALNPKYTLDSFVVGGSNRLAYAAARGIVDKPGQDYNPLFIYGGVGLGKTHLLHGIGHFFAANSLRVHYASCEQFTNEFISSLQDKRASDFRNRYRNAEVLLIDDIQFISGKEQTEECFFHTFNELHNANRQIVVTCDRSPKAIPHLASRLRSRFEWGLVADILPPDLETRRSILKVKARSKGENISLDTLDFIATRSHRNIRELEGNLNRVIAFAKLFDSTPTPELAAKALENIAAKSGDGSLLTPTLLAEAVASSFELTLADLKGTKRDRETSLARQLAMYLMHHDTHCPLAQIGREMGNRNPSTVSHACDKMASDIGSSPYLKRKVATIRDRAFTG